jgi:hypothetical protein
MTVISQQSFFMRFLKSATLSSTVMPFSRSKAFLPQPSSQSKPKLGSLTDETGFPHDLHDSSIEKVSSSPLLLVFFDLALIIFSDFLFLCAPYDGHDLLSLINSDDQTDLDANVASWIIERLPDHHPWNVPDLLVNDPV